MENIVPKPGINKKKFLLKLMAAAAIIFLMDFATGNVLRYFYFKQESGLQYRTTFSMEKTRADVLIFGSSKANHHYHPGVFEEQLKRSYYNAGRDGNSIFYHYAVLKSILKRYTPKIVVLDLVNEEFSKNPESYDRLSSLLPYYKTHPEIRSVVELKSNYEKLKLISSTYPFNSSLLTIAVGNTDYNKARSADIKGYVPIYKSWNGTAHIQNNLPARETDSLKLNAYESFLKDCNDLKIKLYVVVSPYYMLSGNTENASVFLGKQIANKRHVPFLDYSRDTSFAGNAAMFADISHLNDSGARSFSAKLLEDIGNLKN